MSTGRSHWCTRRSLTVEREPQIKRRRTLRPMVTQRASWSVAARASSVTGSP